MVSRRRLPEGSIRGQIAARADGIEFRPRMIRAMLLAVDVGNSNVTDRVVPERRARRRAPGGDAARRRRPTSSSSCSRASFAWTTPRSRTSRRSSLRVRRAGGDATRSRPWRRGASGRCSSPAPGRCRSRSASIGRATSARTGSSTPSPSSRLYGTPAVVVDLGTATTFDCVARDGAFVGGAIAPGVELGLDALAARTAKLPRVELRTPDRAIGRDTASAIQSGAVLGYQALVAGLLGADPPRARRRGRRGGRRTSTSCSPAGSRRCPGRARSRASRRSTRS